VAGLRVKNATLYEGLLKEWREIFK
jgi:hypothetical protein